MTQTDPPETPRLLIMAPGKDTISNARAIATAAIQQVLGPHVHLTEFYRKGERHEALPSLIRWRWTGGAMLKVKRVYERAEISDGARFLVERLWPRGMKKEDLKMQDWLKDVAPTDGLRRWFGHDPSKWREFQKRYRAELAAHPVAWQPILGAARQGDVTLLYSARDTEHNNALVLKSFLEKRLRK